MFIFIYWIVKKLGWWLWNKILRSSKRWHAGWLSIALEFKVAIFNLGPFFVGGSSMYVGTTEQQSYLDSFFLGVLANLPNIYSQLAKLPDMLFVYELGLFVLCLVEYDPHYCLASSDGTVYFSVDLVDRHWVSFPDECVKDVFAELLPLYCHLFWLRVQLWVENCQGVYSVGLFSNPRTDGLRVKPIKTSPSDHRDLRSPGYEYLDSTFIEFWQDLAFQKRWLAEPSNHEDKIYIFSLLFYLIY